jgi:hypothetical protein
MSELDTEYLRAQKVIVELIELNSKVEEKAAALREVDDFLLGLENKRKSWGIRRSTISSSALAAARPMSLASSTLSGSIQTYVDTQLDELREEVMENLVDNESLDRRVSDQVDNMLSHYVEDHQGIEMIEEAIGNAMAKLKERMVRAFE